MPRILLALILAVALAVGVGACVADPDGDDGRPRLVAGFYPLAFVAAQVAGPHGSVTTLTQPGVDAHDLELTPSQVADVHRADLVIYLAGFQPAVDDAVTEYAASASFDVASAVPLRDASAETGAAGDHSPQPPAGQGAEAPSPAGQPDHPHDHGGRDPHVWLDPTRLASIGEALADRLAALDPDHADDYAAGARRLRDELAALDAEYVATLADCQRRELLVSHAAFGYLADRYDLRQIAVSGLSPEDEPTPRRLAEVIAVAERHRATTIYFEPRTSPAIAEVIAAEVGADTAVLNPIEGLAPGSDQDYFSLMRANLDALATGLGCA